MVVQRTFGPPLRMWFLIFHVNCKHIEGPSNSQSVFQKHFYKVLLQSSKGLRAIGKCIDILSALLGLVFWITPFDFIHPVLSFMSVYFAKKTLLVIEHVQAAQALEGMSLSPGASSARSLNHLRGVGGCVWEVGNIVFSSQFFWPCMSLLGTSDLVSLLSQVNMPRTFLESSSLRQILLPLE